MSDAEEMKSLRDEWKSAIRRNLPRCCIKNVLSIQANITAVDAGIKPSFLFDFAFVASSDMASFLEQLYKKGLTLCVLDVISVDDHIFVTKVNELISHFQDDCAQFCKRVVLINVSKNLAVPELVISSHSRRIIAQCIEPAKLAENASDSRCWTIRLSPENNASTLFGLLLGYPVVYWYSPGHADCGNCLDMVPLCITRAFGVLEDVGYSSDNISGRAPIFSFSYPEVLRAHCEESVAMWKSNLLDIAAENKSIEIYFNEEIATLPVVAM